MPPPPPCPPIQFLFHSVFPFLFTLFSVRAYSRNLGQHSILARKANMPCCFQSFQCVLCFLSFLSFLAFFLFSVSQFSLYPLFSLFSLFSQFSLFSLFSLFSGYSKNLGRHPILARKNTFFLEKRAPKILLSLLFNPFPKCFASQQSFLEFSQKGMFSLFSLSQFCMFAQFPLFALFSEFFQYFSFLSFL